MVVRRKEEVEMSRCPVLSTAAQAIRVVSSVVNAYGHGFVTLARSVFPIAESGKMKD